MAFFSFSLLFFFSFFSTAGRGASQPMREIAYKRGESILGVRLGKKVRFIEA